MNKVRIELNSSGVRKLLNDSSVQNFISAEADAILQRLPEGYAKSEYSGRTRPNVSVYPKTKQAAQDNSDNNSILKAVY